MVEDTEIDSWQESCPDLRSLYKRILIWRKELGSQTRPDMEGLREVLRRAQKEEVPEDFLLFVVRHCERCFRIRAPLSLHVRRALQFKLSTKGFTPYNDTDDSYPYQAKGVPLIVDQYVEARLRNLWAVHASEQSRFLLNERIDRLVREFTQPFCLADLQPLPPRRGGYSWEAPWVTGTVIYESLRQQYLKKTDKRPVEVALALTSALLGRSVDQSHFHRKRREILKKYPYLPKSLAIKFKEITLLLKSR